MTSVLCAGKSYYIQIIFWICKYIFLGGEVKFEAQGGAYMVLIFLAILKLAVLIEVVLIK